MDVSGTVAHLRRREAQRATLAAERHERLEGCLPQAREILRRRGATQIFVFGSVANHTTTPESDLDLAVSGLPHSEYFPALGELFASLPVDVDLVRLEEAPDSLRDRVEAEGRRL